MVPDEDKQTCTVSLEPVSCRQRRLCAPVEVTLRTVLHNLDTCCLKNSSSECWVLFCPQRSEQDQVAFQSLFNELLILASDMVVSSYFKCKKYIYQQRQCFTTHNIRIQHIQFIHIFVCVQQAEVNEGGQVHSAVLSVLTSSLAVLTVLHSEEPLCTCLDRTETTDLPDTSDLPEIVSSVLRDIMKDEDTSGMYVTSVVIGRHD